MVSFTIACLTLILNTCRDTAVLDVPILKSAGRQISDSVMKYTVLDSLNIWRLVLWSDVSGELSEFGEWNASEIWCYYTHNTLIKYSFRTA